MTAGRRRAALAAARRTAGHTQETLAAALHIDRSTVIRWEAGDHAPLPYLRPRLARLLGRSPEQLEQLIGDTDFGVGYNREISPDIDVACEWLDGHAGWSPGTSRRKVASRLEVLDVRELRDRIIRRGHVSRGDIVQALSAYYQSRVVGYGTYQARCDGREISTTIVTRPDWIDLACPLTPENDRLTLASPVLEDAAAVDDVAAKCAVHRLVDAVALEVRIANGPLYRLVHVDFQSGAATGTVSLVPFVRYALTMDLLENELIDSIANRTAARPGTLPLRDRYLPNLASVLDISGRLCSGGALALCAIARPSDPYRGASDYVLLLQERSGHVLNTARRLAVIPKGFHEPLADYRVDAQIGATLRREMEEELFGRGDVDSSIAENRVAAPMHPNRLSAPMRWLAEKADRLRLECTGFGYNLISGNCEYAGLIVIDDEEFWSRYGGHIEANWESVGLRQYSSRDRELIADLIADESWSHEGLFAFLQGLRRLAELGGERVNVPMVEWDVV